MRAAPTWLLFVLATLIWGTTWHAIVYQIAVLPPETGVALRFALAALVVLAFSAWRGDRLSLGARVHAGLALQGATMFGLSYIAVYHAERYVPSGLVAIGYSASPLINGGAAALLWGSALGARFVVGGVLGVVGVALIFAPELYSLRGDGALLGAALTVAALLLSSVGNLTAIHQQRRGVPFWPAFGYSLGWGAATSFVTALVLGQRLPALPMPPSWWWSFGYLALIGTVLAFACFLTLQRRVGAGPASTVGVTTPLIALGVSALFEGWQPTALALAGVALAVAGNALMLTNRPSGASRAAG